MGWLYACGITRILEGETSLEEADDKPQTNNHASITDPSHLLPDLRPKAIDLFSGCGGFTLGIAGGFNLVGHVEYDKWALATYELNAPVGGFGRSELIGKDITQITDEQIIQFRRKHGHISLIVGGPPCQGFSTAGRRDPKDPRNSLFIHFVRFVKLMKPDVFIMENVPGLKSMKTAKGKSVFDIILKLFRGVGYFIDWRILNAVNYGVPQLRRRIFVQGQKNGKLPTFPLPTHFGEGEGN